MGFFQNRLGHDLKNRAKDRRRAARQSQKNITAWVRADGGFAVRACRVLDISKTGVRLSVEGADRMMGTFVFMPSRDRGTGRRARVKWRRGAQIGAEFV